MVTSRSRGERREVYRVRTAPGGRVPTSASTDASLRNRTLANYPMEHGHRDTLQSLASQKAGLLQSRVALNRASLTSQGLSRRSKLLFEDSLQGVGSGAPPTTTYSLPKLESRHRSRGEWCTPSYGLRSGPRSRVSSATHSAPGCTGPTLQGSPLYTSRPPLLTGPTPIDESVSPPRHSSMLAADIQRTVERSNSQYRVVTSAGSGHRTTTACSPDFSQYVLEKVVPAGNDVRPEDVLSFGDPEETSTTIIAAAAGPAEPGVRCEISLATEDCGGTPRHVSDPQDPALDPGTPGHTGNQGQQTVETRSRSHKSRRKVTWVDDATVSSPISGADEPETASPRQQPTGITDDNVQMETETGISPKEPASDVQEVSVAVLPDFICPTSEDKSREARTKHWLKANNFTWANRSVPLI